MSAGEGTTLPPGWIASGPSNVPQDPCARNDGGPAFPLATSSGSNESVNGMSLRDWFAGQALAGLLADPEMNAPCEPVARVAYNYADAMLVERERPR